MTETFPQLKLPRELSDRLDAFLAADICTRWDTEEDGEDIFRSVQFSSFLQQFESARLLADPM